MTTSVCLRCFFEPSSDCKKIHKANQGTGNFINQLIEYEIIKQLIHQKYAKR